MRFHRVLALFATMCMALAVAGAVPVTAQAEGGCHVWAYYMGFWSGDAAWQHQANVLSDRPLRGHYNAGDAGVAAAQIDEARGAGIEAFVMDWWGPDEPATTNALNNMLDRAAERGFKAAASIDSFDGVHNVGYGAMASALRHLVNGTVHHPAYLRYRDKPVIFFAFQDKAGLSRGEWQSLRNEIDPGHNTIWVAEGTKTCPLCGPMDGMYAFNMAWSNGNARMYTRDRDVVGQSGGWFYAPTVNPGWDEDAVAARDGRPKPTSRRDRAGGQFLRNLWAGAAATGSDIRMIVSWNEFIENSHIEPSDRYGHDALNVVRDLVSQGCGSPQPTPSGGGGGGGVSPNPGDLIREGDAQQRIQLNPDALLQKRVFRDGFVPNSGEFDTATGDGQWRGQRAENLRDGRVRVYYARLGDWGTVYVAERNRNNNPTGATLLAEGERNQLIQLNPGAALQKRIFAERFVPNSPEFRINSNGADFAAQRAEHLGTGEVRVYYAPVTDYGAVGSVTRPGGRTSGGPPPAPPPPPPSDQPVYRIEAWDRARGQWVSDRLVLPADDICTRVRWFTANIAEVYLDHVGHGPVPGSDEIGEGGVEACLERDNPVPQEWVLHVHLRNGDWVEPKVTIARE